MSQVKMQEQASYLRQYHPLYVVLGKPNFAEIRDTG